MQDGNGGRVSSKFDASTYSWIPNSFDNFQEAGEELGLNDEHF